VEGERDALYAMLSDELTKRESAESQRDHARRMVEAAIKQLMDNHAACPPEVSFHKCDFEEPDKDHWKQSSGFCQKCWSDYLDGLAKEGEEKHG
jgi:hypothetical protein